MVVEWGKWPRPTTSSRRILPLVLQAFPASQEGEYDGQSQLVFAVTPVAQFDVQVFVKELVNSEGFGGFDDDREAAQGTDRKIGQLVIKVDLGVRFFAGSFHGSPIR